MKFIIVDSIEKFKSIKYEWISLEKKIDDFQIFFSWDWVDSYINNVLDNGDKLFIIMIYEKDRCIGIFPLKIVEKKVGMKKYKTLTDIYRYSVDYNDIFIDYRYNRYSLLKKLINFIQKHSNEWDMIELQNWSSRSGTIYLIQDILSKIPELNLITEQHVITPYLDLSCIDNKAKLYNIKNIQRKERKLKKEFKVDIKVNSKFNIEIWNAFIGFHKENWNDSMFNYNEVESFYKILARKMEEKECLEFSYITIDNECAAVHYGFKDDTKIYYYLPACSKKWKNKFSVGAILLYNIITYYKEKGINEFDFLRGNEEYKFDWTDTVFMNYNLTIKNK